MKKVVFILIAAMVFAFTACNEKVDSKYIHHAFKYNKSVSEMKNNIEDPSYEMKYDSYVDTIIRDTCDLYDISSILDEFGINPYYYKKLQDTYGKDNVTLIHTEDIFNEFKAATMIWIEVYGETIYDTTFMWDLAEMKWVGIESGDFWDNF